jgi:hypothetical protein
MLICPMSDNELGLIDELRTFAILSSWVGSPKTFG